VTDLYLGTPTGISFGSNAASGITCTSSTTCTATSPAGSGVVDVTATLNSLTSAVTPADQFTYNIATTAGWSPWYTAAMPSGGLRGALTYDSARQVVLYIGGGPTGTAETWTWAGGGTSWVQLNPLTSPDARTATSLTFDAARGQAVSFGGIIRRSVNGRTISFVNGTTWLWDGTNWSWPALSVSVTPPARHGASLAYDAVRGRVVLFGGCADVSCTIRLNDTWAWDGSAWTQLSPSSSPGPRSSASLAFDGTHGVLVLFGGLDSTGVPLGDTWTWDGSTWTRRTPAPSPAARQGAALTQHPATGGVLLFGGIGASDVLADTWIWNGSTWTQLTPPSSPVVTTMSMAYDAVHRVAVMLGVNATWTWSGQ
jgi:hypothetical protein